MGLFDGPALRFAETFREYLNGRVTQLEESVQTETDPYLKLRNAIVAETLREVSEALRVISER